ncbi:MAG: hypothetical protein IJI88_03555 [Atopobiaceae bacterium]|nr:hypothetical protein [Atopobiaceae bacterium]
MPVTIPVRDLKDTTRVCGLCRETDGPVIVTRNGYQELVLITPERYDEMARALEKQRFYDALAMAEDELAEGRFVDAQSALGEIWAKHGL